MNFQTLYSPASLNYHEFFQNLLLLMIHHLSFLFEDSFSDFHFHLFVIRRWHCLTFVSCRAFRTSILPAGSLTRQINRYSK